MHIETRLQDLMRLLEFWLGGLEHRPVDKQELRAVLRAFQELLGATGSALLAPEPTGFLTCGDLVEPARPETLEGDEGIQRRSDGIFVRGSPKGVPSPVMTLFRFPQGTPQPTLERAQLVARAVANAITRITPTEERAFADYEVLTQIAEGGMARVHLARRAPGDELVALKRIRHHLAENPSFLTLFSQEAQAAAQIDHENVVRISEYGVSDGQAYLAMEYLRGASLEKLLLRGRGGHAEPTVPIVLGLAQDYCAGLQAAHDRKVIHCDVSPHNLFVTFEGRGKVIDFGVARILGSETSHTHPVRGKLGYLALEQISGEPFDHRVDIFGLGVTLYRLLLRDLEPVLALNANDERTQLAALETRVPASLARCIVAAISPHPDARPQSATAFAAGLRVAAAAAGLETANAARIGVWMRDVLGDEEVALRRLLTGQPEKENSGADGNTFRVR